MHGISSSGIWSIPHLSAFFEQPLFKISRLTSAASIKKLTSVTGWGQRPSTRSARALATKYQLPFLSLEDGFLRSFNTGEHSPPLALVCDAEGIYYDCTGPSALETLLNSNLDLLADIAADVARAKGLLLQHQLSKYNHAPVLDPALLRGDDQQRVLVIDQTAGDMSVALGGASAASFGQMLAAAYAENPHATVYVKTHPEVTSGRKKGYLSHVQDDARTVVLRQAINPLSLISQMDKVYVVTSTMGFEALLAGKPVSVFGLPWYAGWGATNDRLSCTRRTQHRSVDELFAAAYFHYSRYLNPLTHQRGTIFDVIDWLVLQRKMASQYAGRMIAVGFRRWKAVNIKPLLSLHAKQVVFVKNAAQAAALGLQASDCLVFWGRQAPQGVTELAAQSGAKLLRMEDGFIRSVGLGSDLIRPLSLVLDEQGIYFDPGQPSALENILNSTQFSVEDCARSQQLCQQITQHGISKYNLEPRATAHWPNQGKEVVLVPGQVEDDASIRYGCSNVKTNLGLLQAARAAHPAAFIVYKPHPDVLSGNRAGKLALAQALQFADFVEARLSVVSCIDACDVVHTMTSLTGFDALLRNKRVVVYGQPFYAGWGLTQDVLAKGSAFARRNRRLSLDELIAGTLLHYPLYWDWSLKGYTRCEAVLQQLIQTRDKLEAENGLEKLRLGFARRQLRKLNILAQAWVVKS